MIKSVLNVTLLVVFVLCLISATVFFGGILPEYTLLLYSLFGPLAALWAVKLFCCRQVSVVWSPTHIPVLLFAGYAILRYAASPIEYDSHQRTFAVYGARRQQRIVRENGPDTYANGIDFSPYRVRVPVGLG